MSLARSVLIIKPIYSKKLRMFINYNAAARAASNYTNVCLFPYHRGVLDGIDMLFAFGNDGFEKDARSQEQVDLLRKELDSLGLSEKAFATSDNGVSWVMVLTAADGVDFDDVDEMEVQQAIWRCWNQACGVDLAMV